MADNKKDNGKSKDGKRKKNTSSSKSKSNGKASQSQVNQRNQFWAIMLFALGTLLLCISLVQGTDGWTVMHDVFRGIFGLSSFVVPAVAIFLAVLFAQNKPKNVIVRRLCECTLGIMLLSGFFQIFFFPEIKGNSLMATLKYIYNDSINLRGGGVIGSIIGLSLLKTFGKSGARIIMIIALVVIAMFLSNVSLLKLFDICKAPFIWLKDTFNELSLGSDEDTIPEDMGVNKNIPTKIKSNKKAQLLEEKQSTNSGIEDDTSDKAIPLSELAARAVEKVKQKFNETFFEYEDDDVQEPSQYDSTFDSELNQLFNSPKDSLQDVEPISDDSMNIDIPLQEESTTIDVVKVPQPTEDIQLQLDDIKKVDNAKRPSKPYRYKYPSTELLEKVVSDGTSNVSKYELETTAKKLIETLESFQAKATIIGISKGPAVTRYEVQPQSGIKVSKITGLADDIALNLATSGVRMEAPIPGKSAIGVEVPNKTTDVVSIRELLESDAFKSAKKKSKLSFVAGKDIAGNVIVGDIAKMPHVIIAGATGSGKSVCTNSIIMSILYNASPSEVKFILIDPKIVEFQHYAGIPHLLIPVVTDPKKATGALNWAVQEMLKRYQLFADNKVKDLGGYNQKVAETGEGEKLPQIVIAIDELADLMMVAKGDVEEAICRLAQMARAAGMHLIIATQRPTVDIITGLIKANIPSRIALSVMSSIDSRTIIDINGAEKLLGHGDMLYFPTGMQKPLRLQGCWVSPKDIENTVNFIKQDFEADYSENIMEEIEKAVPLDKGSKKNTSAYNGDEPIPNSDEELVQRAIDLIMENNLASTSMLQRRLKLGYARAGRIMDEICEMGIVGEARGSKPREILITKAQWTERKLNVNTENE
ncbi:MAG: DNA translocase FtsK [Ruminococcus sp.]|nr:DNA translocase FtsK [Ruminococcus sp.]